MYLLGSKSKKVAAIERSATELNVHLEILDLKHIAWIEQVTIRTMLEGKEESKYIKIDFVFATVEFFIFFRFFFYRHTHLLTLSRAHVLSTLSYLLVTYNPRYLRYHDIYFI